MSRRTSPSCRRRLGITRQLESLLSLTPATSHHNIHVVRAAEYMSMVSPSRRRSRPQLGPFIFLQLGPFFRSRGCYGGTGSSLHDGSRCRECCEWAGIATGLFSLLCAVRLDFWKGERVSFDMEEVFAVGVPYAYESSRFSPFLNLKGDCASPRTSG
jgi:hypothetical protein